MLKVTFLKTVKDGQKELGSAAYEGGKLKVEGDIDALLESLFDGIDVDDEAAVEAALRKAPERFSGSYLRAKVEGDDVKDLTSQGDDVTLYGFTGGGAGFEAAEGEGVYWKEVLHPGVWSRMDSGKPIMVTPDIVEAAYEAYKSGLPKYISVPASHHFRAFNGVVPAEHNRGFVQELKMGKGHRLFAKMKFTNEEARTGVSDGSIADVSAFLEPNVVHPETGKRHKWALRHVLLTNDPQIQDLSPFSDKKPEGFGLSGHVVMFKANQQKEEKRNMPDGIYLSGEELEQYKQIQEAGGVKAFAALQEQQEKLAARMREAEINSVVMALQGQGEHDGVEQIEGYRHAPVVIEAVQEALTKATDEESLALSANGEGQTGVDSVILEVVNAIPKEGRIALDAQSGGKKNRKPPEGGDEEEKEIPDEAIEEFAAKI